MRTAITALVAYYVGVTAPLSFSPFVCVALLVLVGAIAWANLLETDVERRNAPVQYVDIPRASSRRRSS